jgi:hypothetical protein
VNALPNGAKRKEFNNMAKLHEIDPDLDPIVIAAMLDDDEPEQEEEKSTDSEDKSSQAADDKSNNDDSDDDDSDKEDQEEGNEVVEDKSTEKEDVEDEDTENEEDDPDKKPTRKEKREAKRKRYLESIRKEGEQTTQRRRDELFSTDPNYKPLDYNDVTELDVKDLQNDRTNYGRTNFSKGAQLERFYADQEKFWQGVEYEDKLLQTDPKYNFLNEKSKKYDPDLAEELHEKFFELIGFNPETQVTRRTDISFSNFVKREIGDRENWAARTEDQIVKNAAAQRSTSSIRPGGSPTRSLGKLKPGDISKMSQKDFEKHEAEIDRQILAELGQ